MKLRQVAGFLTGVIIWWFLFIAIGIGFGMLWPGYREAARLLFSAADSSRFTTTMFLLNYLVFIVTGIATGWFAASIGKGRIPALVVALFYLILMAINHFYLEWNTFPSWYNVIVPFVISGSIAIGSQFVRSDSRVDNRKEI